MLTTEATIKNSRSFSSHSRSPVRRYKNTSSETTTKSSKLNVSTKLMTQKNDLYEKIIEKIIHKDENAPPANLNKNDSPKAKLDLSTLRSPSATSKLVSMDFNCVGSRKTSTLGNLKKINLADSTQFQGITKMSIGIIKSVYLNGKMINS